MVTKDEVTALRIKADDLWQEYYRKCDERYEALMSGEYNAFKHDLTPELDAATSAQLEYETAWTELNDTPIEVLVQTTSHPDYRKGK